MFTGIIEETGTIKKIELHGESGKLFINASKVLSDVSLGDSIAVNGVCLTVTSFTTKEFTADVMAETLRCSSLGSLVPGSRVNLERAMAANGRFGGHIVSGHIDGTGKISSMKPEGNAIWVTITPPAHIQELIIPKGSIAIDGISLTVAKRSDTDFSVSIIPHTGEETILLSKKAGDVVNLENDVVGKYVRALLDPYTAADTSSVAGASKPESKLTLEMLTELGF